MLRFQTSARYLASMSDDYKKRLAVSCVSYACTPIKKTDYKPIRPMANG